ncbi:thioredoxin domain-containing protein [uncultured Aquimarina sp.]|uniref:thioredoxin domain-containing protein n=1 Tax=uncultured Aquimarina sp. TaxID=575652 RepID=UPI002617B92D|nr:thioredoxin domain-containing protein [uncultured Aquimarina sp.]
MKNIKQLKYSVLFVMLLHTTTTIAKVQWIHDFELGRAIAIEQKKWMVVDFWASWCGPCKRMDDKLWQTTAINSVKDNFVFVKVDFDRKRELAKYFSVKSLPTVLIMDPNKAVIDRKTGYRHTDEYINWFKKIPNADLKNVYTAMIPMIRNRKSSVAHLKLGVAYQNLAMSLSNASIRSVFIKQSNQQFKVILKKSKNEDLLHKVQLYKLLNKAIAGKSKSVLKKLNQKTPIDYTTELVELVHFIKCYCYLKEGNDKALSIEKKQLKNLDMLALLEQ